MTSANWRLISSPQMRYWTPGSLGRTLKPSAQYALLYSSNFISYQLPIILMQRILGPAAVVVYSVTRTIYSMSRRVLYLVTNSIGPEVTITFGERNWKKLHRLYDLSERIVLLLMVAPITFSSMLLTPLLLRAMAAQAESLQPSSLPAARASRFRCSASRSINISSSFRVTR